MFHVPFNALFCVNSNRAKAFVSRGNNDVGILFYFSEKFYLHMGEMCLVLGVKEVCLCYV